MRKKGATGDEIVEALIANSATFDKKTAFSQERYRVKKQKKYAPRVLLRRPFTRSICEAYFKKHAEKIGLVWSLISCSESRYLYQYEDETSVQECKREWEEATPLMGALNLKVHLVTFSAWFWAYATKTSKELPCQSYEGCWTSGGNHALKYQKVQKAS